MEHRAADDRRALWLRPVVLATLAAACVFGALQLEFLCDDAFITFRYVSNARDGHGLVWNAAPFVPVEGYTGFLWALLLWATWAWFGVEPPHAANVLSIGCGLLLFAATAWAAFGIRDREGRKLPDLAIFVTLAVVVGNRTFLQWMTSGLETALFNLGFVLWVVLAFRRPPTLSARWLAAWSSAAAIAALTRPDGLLLAAATAAVACIALLRERSWRTTLLGLSPLLAVAGHVLWRRAFYGEWLPNTYYAKVTTPWPAAGVRYFLCFAIEHGTWLWLLLAAGWLSVAIRRKPQLRRLFTEYLPATAATAAVLWQVGYYVFVVGGDHFEYRVLSHLIPLLALSGAAMAWDLRPRAWLPTTALAAIGTASCFGWLHLALVATPLIPGFDPLSPKVPALLQPLARIHDRYQAWLQMQFNCVRVGAHAQSARDITRYAPTRSRLGPSPDDLNVAKAAAVGIVGWVLPDCAVIDVHGLNDWVGARTPLRERQAGFLPPQLLQRIVSEADANRDGNFSRAELEAAFVATGSRPPDAATLVDRLLIMFARARDDGLSTRELDDVGHYVDTMRFIAHERLAPAEYVGAFDPNVTFENDKRIGVRKREQPLTPERVRPIETEWRQRIRAAANR